MNAAPSVTWTRDADGNVRVDVEPDVEPLERFLAVEVAGDVGHLRMLLGAAVSAARAPADTEPWQLDGNEHSLTVAGGVVTIDHMFADRTCTLDTSVFAEIVRSSIEQLEAPQQS